MVLDIEPISDVVALPIDRQRLSREAPDDHVRNELLREMIGAVIVRAIGQESRKPIGLAPCADEVIDEALEAE